MSSLWRVRSLFSRGLAAVTATLTLGGLGECGACRSFLGWSLQSHRAVSTFSGDAQCLDLSSYLFNTRVLGTRWWIIQQPSYLGCR